MEKLMASGFGGTIAASATRAAGDAGRGGGPGRAAIDGRRPSGAGRALLGCVLVSSIALALGCGQEDPPTTPPGETVEPSYYPLVDGATWSYQHSDWVEQVTATARPGEAKPTFLMSDSPNPKDNLRSDSIVVVSDGRAARVSKEEYQIGGATPVLTSSVTYGVGFTRFNEAWTKQAVGYKETPEYVRIETPPGGSPKAPEERRHTFEVISLSEQVVTAAGTFDCIVIKRTKDWQAEEDGVDASDAATKTYWFARGVGKVQERNEETRSTEVLTDFDIPTPSNAGSNTDDTVRGPGY
jgi:hypothetical protein